MRVSCSRLRMGMASDLVCLYPFFLGQELVGDWALFISNQSRQKRYQHCQQAVSRVTPRHKEQLHLPAMLFESWTHDRTQVEVEAVSVPIERPGFLPGSDLHTYELISISENREMQKKRSTYINPTLRYPARSAYLSAIGFKKLYNRGRATIYLRRLGADIAK